MCTLPVALIGALAALAMTHQSLNVFSVISIVMLFGLAAKTGFSWLTLRTEQFVTE